MALLHEDRLFPADEKTRAIARRLYDGIKALPIVSPHGHTQAGWFARNEPFPDPVKLFVQPDHYVFRMLYSQGISLEDLEIGQAQIKNPRQGVADFRQQLSPVSRHADAAVAGLRISGAVRAERAAERGQRRIITTTRSRRSWRRRNSCRAPCMSDSIIEVLATTDSRFDSLADHAAIRESGWKGRIVPTFRPDAVVDPEFPGFLDNLRKAGGADGREHDHVARLSARAREAAGIFQIDGCDGDRSRASHGADDGPERDQRGDAVRAGDQRNSVCGGPGDFPRPDADRDGAHERGRWAGDADSSRLGAQPQRAARTRSMGATWAPTFPRRRIMWRRCGRC